MPIVKQFPGGSRTAGVGCGQSPAVPVVALKPHDGQLSILNYLFQVNSMEGRISYWNQKRGFGFVKKDTGRVAFVHIRSVVDDSVDAPPIGTRIAFGERPPKGAEDRP